MENYKKLLELLRSDPDCDTCGFEECNHNSCLLEVRSADAIENLLTENAVLRKQADDLTKAGLIATDKANQAIAKMHETKSELESALSDLKAAAIGEDVCTLCAHCCASGEPLYHPEEQYMEYCDGCDNDYSNFKWRSPQKEV